MLFLIILVSFSYLLIASFQANHFQGKVSLPRRCFYIPSGFVFLGHGWLLYQWIEGHNGQNLDWANMASLTVWILVGFILVSPTQKTVANYSIIVYPLAGLSIILAYLLPGEHIMDTKTNLGVLTHIILSIFALCCLGIAALHAIFLWLQDHMLKTHNPSPILKKLPPLQAMEQAFSPILRYAFLSLSLSLLSGWLFLENLWSPFILPKTIMSIIAWIMLAVLILGQHRLGWRGPTVIKWVLTTVLIVLLAYYGTKAYIA